jgi:glutamine synthetase
VLGRYARDGLVPVVAVELEFYLIDRDLTPDGRPQVPVSPVTGRREATLQTLSMSALSEFDEFFAGVERAAAVQGVPAEAAVSEAAIGQYEINLKHESDALIAADHGVLLRRLIRRGDRGRPRRDVHGCSSPTRPATACTSTSACRPRRPQPVR